MYGGGQQNQSLKGNLGIENEQLKAAAAILGKEDSDSHKGMTDLLIGDATENQSILEGAIRHQAPIYVGVIKHQNRVLVRTRDLDAMAEIRRLYKKLDTESSMLLMEVKVLSIDLSDGYNSLFDFKVKSGDFGVSTHNATQTIGAIKALDTGLRTAASTFDPALLATVVSENFEARLQLLEKENRVTELATPMLLTTNQEVSRVFVGEDRPIVSGYSSSSSTTTNTAIGTPVVSTPILVPETEMRSIGTTLLLTPNINADRTVAIQLLVSQNTLAPGKATIPVPDTNTGTVLYPEVDIVQDRIFSGTVVAKDATAVAVGGLIEEAAGDSEKKVPILGDIPLLGFFFREDAKLRERRELVIIMKPHIMATPAEAEPTSLAMLQDNSIHPDAQNAGNLDIYSNPDHQHKGYVLDKPYKEYDKQDVFDKYRGRGDSREFSKNPSAPQQFGTAPREVPANQQVYIDLTQYASEAIRVPANERQVDPKISPVPVQQFEQVDLTYDSRIWAMPLAGWRQGGVYVTAVELHNLSPDQVTVDYQRLKGRWLASTIENEVLDREGSNNNVTYLYLISGQPFEEAIVKSNR